MGNTVIQLRNDTASNWTTDNPTLALGEMGIETDTNKIKIGDGSTAWNSLSYLGGSSSIQKILGVTMSSAQTLATSTWRLIHFNNVNTDVYSAFDNSAGNYKFTAPSDGTYFVQATLHFGSSGANSRDCAIYVNGSRIVQQCFESGGVVYSTVGWWLTLNANDYVQIYGWQNSGGNLNIGISDPSYFEIYSGV